MCLSIMEPDLVLFFVGFSAMLVGTAMLGEKRLSANFRGRLFTGPVRQEFLLIGFGLLFGQFTLSCSLAYRSLSSQKTLTIGLTNAR